jgi:hypothetical protein
MTKLVGISVGSSEGSPECIMVGAFVCVGMWVGNTEGLLVGHSVGIDVDGMLVGNSDGIKVVGL